MSPRRNCSKSLNDSALKLEKNPQDLEIVREIRRTVHTLKGDAAACSFRELSEAAHELEDALALEQIPAGGSLADVAFAAADAFNGMLNAYRKHKKPPAADSLHKMIRKLSDAPKGKAGAKKKARKPRLKAAVTVWTEYEELAIQKALAAEKHVYHLNATIDANCAMPIAARQLVLNGMKSVGEVLGIRPDAASPLATKRIELLFASEHSAEKVSAKCSIPTVIADVKCEVGGAQTETCCHRPESS